MWGFGGLVVGLGKGLKDEFPLGRMGSFGTDESLREWMIAFGWMNRMNSCGIGMTKGMDGFLRNQG